MELIIEPYDCLPCALRKFRINGTPADTYDFGENYDHEPEEAEPYGCGCHEFDANREDMTKIKTTCDKYHITLEEYLEICNSLEEKLYVGRCGWCV